MTIRVVAVGTLAASAAVLLTAGVLVVWLAAVGAGVGSAGAADRCTGSVGTDVPAHLRPIFRQAAARYDLGPEGPSVLAALTSIESGYGRNMGPSSAGAIGWTQFLPSTWAHYGVDADGDGRRDPYNAHDAIHSAANYLRASGAPSAWRRALYAYNHAEWYVEKVLREAARLRSPDVETACVASEAVGASGVRRVTGGGRIVPIPGMPGETVDVRILRDVLWMVAAFRVRVTDGYATSGHAADGEHPLGLAIDLVPGPGGSWDDIDRLAHWAEPRQGRPRAPFRWVGYDGDSNHGRGHHLHLSWNHAEVPSRRPPAAWVDVVLADE